MVFSTVFFDLDDTLYSNSNGLWHAIRHRMGLYMAEKLGLPEEKVPEIRQHYFLTYGTTLRGLQKHHQVDADDYLAYVHDLPLTEYLKPDPDLRSLLLELPQQRFIFTNADREHALRVLTILGVEDCFDGLIDVRAIEFACKPELIAYQRAMAIAGHPPAETCVMVDDSSTNLAPARQLGFTTVWINPECMVHPAASVSVRGLDELRLALPDLWDGHEGPANG